MKLINTSVIVTGGASGLGAATARLLAAAGAKVAICDKNYSAAQILASEINGLAIECDVSDEDSARVAFVRINEVHGIARVLINCAGIPSSGRIVGKQGPMALTDFEKTIRINLIGSFNMLRLAATEMITLNTLEEDERGVIISTASIAAYEGQIGQAAYAASKGGIVSLTLPAAREFAQFGIRVNAIAPGLFLTPLLEALPGDTIQKLSDSIPFPKRLGSPDDFAALVKHIIENPYLNGEVIRLDGALRMQPK